MRVLILAVLLTFPNMDDGFSVELLTPSEVIAIDKAEKDFAEAQAAHENILNQIRYAHGQSIQGTQWAIMCGGTTTTVELRGKYALIQKRPSGVCIVPATFTK